MERIFSSDELNKLLVEWQKRLKLGDWNIRLIKCRANKMTENCLGEVNYELSNLTAVIHLLDEIDYPSELFSYDMEQVLVHELLHLVFATVTPDDVGSLKHTLFEQSIEKMANVFIEFKEVLCKGAGK